VRDSGGSGRPCCQQERQPHGRAELERGDLVLVVLGAGSVGKTSLIRGPAAGALVGDGGGCHGLHQRQPALSVAAAGPAARHLAGGHARHSRRRGVPGPSASGWHASRLPAADLLLLVVDGDLRAAEAGGVSKPWRGWASGCCWCSTSAICAVKQEESRLLDLLRQRCGELLATGRCDRPPAPHPKACPAPGWPPAAARPGGGRPAAAGSPQCCMPTVRN
jgi:hypothetical protein